MTPLQDFHSLGRRRKGSSEEQANQKHAALLPASPQHETQDGKGEKRNLEVELCVEEDSGYQTSENENDENGKEDESEAPDLAYETRKQRPIRHLFSSYKAEILDLSFARGEKGLTRGNVSNGIDEIFDSAYERKEKRHIKDSFMNNGAAFLDSQHETKEREPTRDSFSDDRETLDLANVRKHKPLLGDRDDDLEAGCERRKRELDRDSFGNECEASGSGQERVKRRRTSNSESDSDEFLDLIDEEQEEKAATQTEEVSANPLAATPFHSGLHCCTNGFFRATGGASSNFESNCGCTTHSLVDWRTRVSWTNLDLFQQVKIREVTVLSPFRTSVIPWGLPYFSWRCSPLPQPLPQPQQPLPLPLQTQSPALTPKPPARTPQQTPKVKKEQNDDTKNAESERGYRCEQMGCGRTFCRNEELTRHLRIHSGQRPYVCQKCGRRFVRRDHLTKHQRTHLPAHVKRSYTCPLPACTHRYTRSDALTRHMWTAHHIRARQPPRGATTTTTTHQHPANHHHSHHHLHHHHPDKPKLET